MNRLLRAAPSWSLGAVFLLAFAGAFAFAWELPARARPFPLFVVTAGIVLVAVEIALALVRPGDPGADTGLDLRPDDGHGFREALRIGAPYAGWVAGLLVAVWLIGPTLAVPLWLAAYFLVVVGAGPLQTAAAVAGFSVLTVALFDYLLQVPWPAGIVPGVQQGAQSFMQSLGI